MGLSEGAPMPTVAPAIDGEVALDRLVRAQRRDDESDRVPRHGREVLECDWAAPDSSGLDGLAAPAADPASTMEGLEVQVTFSPRGRPRTITVAVPVVIGVDVQWDEPITRYDPQHGGPCPACRGRLHGFCACVVCSAATWDRRAW